MQRFKVVVLALVAVFAMSAVAVASASATLPEYSKVKVKFNGKSEGETELKAGSEIVKCSGGESKEGEIASEKGSTKITIHFTGCKKGTANCQSASTVGEIVTTALSGELGYLEKATKKVGNALKPTSGTEFVKFKCEGGIETVVTGCVIGEVPPTSLNVSTTKFKQLFEELEGKQKYTKFEGGSTCQLTAFGFIGAVQIGKSVTETKEALEIKA